MVLIESDIILALISKEDRHHHEAIRIVREVKPLKISPYAIIELDLLILSDKIEVKIPVFYENLTEMLKYYDIEIVKLNPRHQLIGWNLRKKYNLTYFDSLHASVSIVENEPLVSYDKVYQKIKELKYLTPKEALKRYV